MTDRSTLRLDAQLDRADRSGQSVILEGNTTDYVVAEDGSPRRIPFHLAAQAATRGRATIVYSMAAGARQMPLPGQSPIAFHLPSADVDAADAIEAIIRTSRTTHEPVQVTIDYAGLAIPHLGQAVSPMQNRILEMLAEFVIDPVVRMAGHRVAIITRTGAIDDRLPRFPGFATVTVELPDYGERLAFIERLLQPQNGDPLRLAPGLKPERLAELSGGLALVDLLKARDESRGGAPVDVGWVHTQKVDALRRIAGDTLIVYPPGNGLVDVAGLPQGRRIIKTAIASGRVPRRLVLAGPPGVGKTLFCTALADELGIAAVALGNVRSMWVGESERNLRAVLDVLLAMAPVLLHIDEIDQAVGQRQTGQSADGGTSERLLADLMTFLGANSTKRIVVVATTNRPDLMDSAMFDRFKVIPVLHPSPIEAAQILVIAARKENRQLSEDDARRSVEEHDQLLTGRLLVDVLDEAMTIADADGSTSTVTKQHLDAAFDDLLMGLDAAEHERLALRAVSLTTFASYLPWIAANALGEPVHLPSYVPPLLTPSGALNTTKLRHRLNELQ